MRELTKKEMMEEDDIGCMDPRAMDWFTIVSGIAILIGLFFLGMGVALLYCLIRSNM